MATTDADTGNNLTVKVNKQKDDTGYLRSTNEEHIAEMIYIIFGGVIIIIGTIGNSLSLIILRKGDLKKLSTCFYMSMLAVADLGKTYI